MCGRFSLAFEDVALAAAALGVSVADLAGFEPRYNIAPTDEIPIVRQRREQNEVLFAKWGLVNSWANDPRAGPKNINARAETIDTRPSFKEAFVKRRCIVPATGFYEWTGSAKARQPLWFHRDDGQLLLFAGLYESYKPADQDMWQPTFTIITTASSGEVARIHDRMPVILPPDEIDRWIDPAETDDDRLKAMLRPASPVLLAARRVSSRVNSVRNEGPELLDPVMTLDDLL